MEEGAPPRTPEELDAWRRHKRRGRGKKVIVKAEIDLATKTKEVVNVDMWYGNIYEFYNSEIDMQKYAEIQDIFNHKATITPRLVLS